jgi:hypothetical protein
MHKTIKKNMKTNRKHNKIMHKISKKKKMNRIRKTVKKNSTNNKHKRVKRITRRVKLQIGGRTTLTTEQREEISKEKQSRTVYNRLLKKMSAADKKNQQFPEPTPEEIGSIEYLKKVPNGKYKPIFQAIINKKEEEERLEKEESAKTPELKVLSADFTNIIKPYPKEKLIFILNLVNKILEGDNTEMDRLLRIIKIHKEVIMKLSEIDKQKLFQEYKRQLTEKIELSNIAVANNDSSSSVAGDGSSSNSKKEYMGSLSNVPLAAGGGGGGMNNNKLKMEKEAMNQAAIEEAFLAGVKEQDNRGNSINMSSPLGESYAQSNLYNGPILPIKIKPSDVKPISRKNRPTPTIPPINNSVDEFIRNNKDQSIDYLKQYKNALLRGDPTRTTIEPILRAIDQLITEKEIALPIQPAPTSLPVDSGLSPSVGSGLSPSVGSGLSLSKGQSPPKQKANPLPLASRSDEQLQANLVLIKNKIVELSVNPNPENQAKIVKLNIYKKRIEDEIMSEPRLNKNLEELTNQHLSSASNEDDGVYNPQPLDPRLEQERQDRINRADSSTDQEFIRSITPIILDNDELLPDEKDRLSSIFRSKKTVLTDPNNYEGTIEGTTSINALQGIAARVSKKAKEVNTEVEKAEKNKAKDRSILGNNLKELLDRSKKQANQDRSMRANPEIEREKQNEYDATKARISAYEFELDNDNLTPDDEMDLASIYNTVVGKKILNEAEFSDLKRIAVLAETRLKDYETIRQDTEARKKIIESGDSNFRLFGPRLTEEEKALATKNKGLIQNKIRENEKTLRQQEQILKQQIQEKRQLEQARLLAEQEAKTKEKTATDTKNRLEKITASRERQPRGTVSLGQSKINPSIETPFRLPAASGITATGLNSEEEVGEREREREREREEEATEYNYDKGDIKEMQEGALNGAQTAAGLAVLAATAIAGIGVIGMVGGGSRKKQKKNKRNNKTIKNNKGRKN